MPFAAGLDLFIIVQHLAGTAIGAAAEGAFAALALAGWYGVGYIARQKVGAVERRAAADRINEVANTPLHAWIEHMLTEARVILLGAQALFGFQIAIVLTHDFEHVPAASRPVRGWALASAALSVILLMAPAAYERIVYAGRDASAFLRVGGWLVSAAATAPLALGVAGDSYVVFAKISNSPAIGATAAAVIFAMVCVLWYAYPLNVRRQVPA